MIEAELVALLKRSIKAKGYGDDWVGDVACKVYAYPLSSVILQGEAFEEYVEADLLTIKKDKKKAFIMALLGALQAAFAKARKGVEHDVFMSVVVYGMVGMKDWEALLTSDGCASAAYIDEVAAVRLERQQ